MVLLKIGGTTGNMTAMTDLETSTSAISMSQVCVLSFTRGHALFPGKP